MQKLWKVDTTRWEVREVQVSKEPQYDSEDDRIYTNTHYEGAGEAWNGLLRNAQAGLRMSADAVERARSNLQEAEQRAADDAVNYTKVARNYEKSQGQPNA